MYLCIVCLQKLVMKYQLKFYKVQNLLYGDKPIIVWSPKKNYYNFAIHFAIAHKAFAGLGVRFRNSAGAMDSMVLAQMVRDKALLEEEIRLLKVCAMADGCVHRRLTHPVRVAVRTRWRNFALIATSSLQGCKDHRGSVHGGKTRVPGVTEVELRAWI